MVRANILGKKCEGVYRREHPLFTPVYLHRLELWAVRWHFLSTIHYAKPTPSGVNGATGDNTKGDPIMRYVLTALLLLLPCTATAGHYDPQDGKPRNSYELQLNEYEKTGVDNERNGPLWERQETDRTEQRTYGRSIDPYKQPERYTPPSPGKAQNSSPYNSSIHNSPYGAEGGYCTNLYGC